MMEWWAKSSLKNFMWVDRKPHPAGVECHTSCCAQSGVLYHIEPVETSDLEAKKEFTDYLLPMAALTVRMTKQIWHTGATLCVDSAFTTVAMVHELETKYNVHIIGVVKKHGLNWPAELGDVPQWLTEQLNKLEVGALMSCTGVRDSDHFQVHLTGYVDIHTPMILLHTTGTTEPSANTVNRWSTEGKRVEIARPDVADLFSQGKHAVDDHDHMRQGSRPIEQAVQSKNPAVRQFWFVIGGITEINSMCFYNFAHRNDPDFKQLNHMQWREMLVDGLLLDFANPLPQNPRPRIDNTMIDHAIMVYLPNETWDHAKSCMVYTLCSDYPVQRCPCCDHRERHYCKCSPWHGRCLTNFTQHMYEPYH